MLTMAIVVDGDDPTLPPHTSSPTVLLQQEFCSVATCPGPGSSDQAASEGVEEVPQKESPKVPLKRPAGREPNPKKKAKKNEEENDDASFLGVCKGNRKDDEDEDDEPAASAKKEKEKKEKKSKTAKSEKKTKKSTGAGGRKRKGTKAKDGLEQEDDRSGSSSESEREGGVSMNELLDAMQTAQDAEVAAVLEMDHQARHVRHAPAQGCP